MSDRKFEFVKLGQMAGEDVARICVMGPLVMGKQGNQWSMSHLLLGAEHLLRWWRLRLVELKNAGWPHLCTDDRNLRFARNCCPSMFIFDDEEHLEYPACCKCRCICPWCYGRQSALIYSAFSAARPKDEQLFAAIGSVYESMNDGPLHERLAHHADKLKTLVNGNLPNVVGNYSALTVEPAKGDWQDHWRYRYRILSWIPVGKHFNWIPQDKNWKTNLINQPTGTQLRGNFSMVCKYPEGLMRGSARRVVEVLTARRGLWLSRLHGTVYDRHNTLTQKAEEQ